MLEFDKDGKPIKPVKEMTEAEKKEYKEKVLEKVSTDVSKGSKFTKMIVLDTDDYKGEIILHRPTINEMREIGIREARYRLGYGDAVLDVVTQNICLYLATFDVIVDKAPDWWKPAEMFDYNILEYVWEEYANWRMTFRQFSKPKHQGDSQAAVPETPLVDSKNI